MRPRAHRIGLVNQVADDAEPGETTMIMARKIAGNAGFALGYTKKNLNAAEVGEFATIHDMEAVQAFKDKRKPVFQGR